VGGSAVDALVCAALVRRSLGGPAQEADGPRFWRVQVNIYVGNLSFDAGDAELQAAFEEYGEVTSARVITDKFTGKSRGFGFVEMPSSEEARAAIEALNGADMFGRELKVNEARPSTGGGGRGGGRGGYGGGGGRGGGRGHGGGSGRGGGRGRRDDWD
jgi:RNA recognition motif-containing protein